MTSFEELSRQVAQEAAAEGREAVEELRLFEDYYRLARQLAERRLALGMKQEDLAQATGISQSEISRIEQGRANPTFGRLSRLSRALDLQVCLEEVCDQHSACGA
jgi:ribosome-binding protein aMBF1 (putative translation factor)